jgi:Resolvase, N terminal domain
MLTVLGGLAEFERDLIRARTAEGRKRAQARGVRFGRKLKLTQHQITEALQRKAAGEALVEIGRSYNVSHSTDIEAYRCVKPVAISFGGFGQLHERASADSTACPAQSWLGPIGLALESASQTVPLGP